MTNEVKVGILVFAALVLLAVLVFGVGEIRIFERGVEYRILFNSVAGLNEGSSVRLGGVKVGHVRNIDFTEYQQKRMVEVTVVIKESVPIRKGDKFKITMLGLLGENYVEITPGVVTEDVVEPGSQIEGETVVAMDQMFEDVQAGLGRVNDILDDETVDNFKKTVKHTEAVSADLEYIVGTSKVDIISTVHNLNSASMRLDRLVARNEASLNATLDNVTVISENAVGISEDLETITGRLERGEGTAGKILADEALYNEVLDTTTEAKGLIQDIKERPGRYIKLSIF
jgi:phospholipid/cholesterol/gamma-HCH transport system substrate-binding protein